MMNSKYCNVCTCQNRQAKLNESEAKLRNLESNKKALEEDIAVKTNSLNIDQSQCLRLRKTLVWRRHEINF
jgi:hypothetical protein